MKLSIKIALGLLILLSSQLTSTILAYDNCSKILSNDLLYMELKPDCIDSTQMIDPSEVYFGEKSRIDWSKHEKTISVGIRESLISRFNKHYQFIKSDPSYQDRFHFVYLNGDNLIDVIVEGQVGEAVRCDMYINNGGDFELIFSAYQELSELCIINRKLQSFNTVYLCTGGQFVYWKRFYSLVNNVVEMEKKYARVNLTTPPAENFKHPVKFKLINSNYSLRFEPKIENDPLYVPWMTERGNIVAEYEKGDMGTAYGQKVDSTGSLWWFVRMEPKTNYKSSVFYDEKPGNSYYLGWMNRRYLEEINQTQ